MGRGVAAVPGFTGAWELDCQLANVLAFEATDFHDVGQISVFGHYDAVALLVCEVADGVSTQRRLHFVGYLRQQVAERVGEPAEHVVPLAEAHLHVDGLAAHCNKSN